jgi:hypothetical protein
MSFISNPPAGAALNVREVEAFSGTSPSSFTDLDLSSIVGRKATLVILKIFSSIAAKIFAVRKNGDSDNAYVVTLGPAGAALMDSGNVHLVLVVLTDPAGIIEWKSETAQACTVDVIGYVN